ncbi:TIR domain-containing protein [Solihabitans fulvus]|uniref:TIR domain-containing protein n=1 Tax=Solihabitans fulvus TaxID=1892852 RepID=A0A5B2XE98_9PSEU|nr:toll/interleukin-1 receptor domain-containing protein [Solihabitans fulvus]KAA2261281.1 TIR domain-containing protein [Solihabitans fulvus]
MPGVFINYRQNHLPDPKGPSVLRGHAQLVEAIAERLSHHFGEDLVFLDTTLRIASRYPDELRKRLNDSDVVLVVIHREWLDDLSERRKRAVNGVKDWVHFEIETALAEGKPVVPLLLHNAGLPTEHQLTTDIAELSKAQAHTLQFGRMPEDINKLIRAIELFISPTQVVPQVPAKPAPKPRDRHWRGLLCVGLAGFLAPALMWVPPSPPRDRLIWMVALSAVMLIILVVPLGLVATFYLFRKPIDSTDRTAAEIPSSQRTNMIIGLTIAGLAAIMMITGDMLDRIQRVLLLFGIVLMFAFKGNSWMHLRELAARWPQPALSSDPSEIRYAVTRLRTRLDEWRAPLSRLQHDQARFALDQLLTATTALRDEDLDRRTWLCRASRWLTFPHAALLTATIGMASNGLTLWLLAGGGLWPSVALLAGCGVAACATHFGAVELCFRLQRWRKQVVLDAVPAQLGLLGTRLRAMSIPPSTLEGQPQ